MAATRTKKPSKSPEKPKALPKAGARDGEWRAETLGRMRALILEADPKMIEEDPGHTHTHRAGLIPDASLGGQSPSPLK